MENLKFKKSELFQTWIFKTFNPIGWHFTTEQIDIIKFKEDEILDMINIEQGLVRSVHFEIKENQEIIIDSSGSFGFIQLVNKDELILESKSENSISESIYARLQMSQIELEDSAIGPLINSFRWICEKENPNGKLIWTINKNQLELKSNKKIVALPSEIKMPFELKKVEGAYFLSCQKPNLFGNAPETIQGRENYFIHKISENEIHVELGSSSGIQIFKKEKTR